MILNLSSYLFQKEVNSFKESSENFKNLESRKKPQISVEEFAITDEEKVTDLIERGENLNPQKDTASYLFRNTEEVTREVLKVTETIDPMVVDNTPSKLVISKEERESGRTLEREAKSDNEMLAIAPTVTDSSLTEADIYKTPK
ncbi:MAG: hypothetical protein HC820_08680, partial [Hydrococcus sp. RM1_1_31]|nr:hypothetical protein [Hydrococcus sp. RM1_1_31]